MKDKRSDVVTVEELPQWFTDRDDALEIIWRLEELIQLKMLRHRFVMCYKNGLDADYDHRIVGKNSEDALILVFEKETDPVKSKHFDHILERIVFIWDSAQEQYRTALIAWRLTDGEHDKN